jgi:hypothetical protein
MLLRHFSEVNQAGYFRKESAQLHLYPRVKGKSMRKLDQAIIDEAVKAASARDFAAIRLHRELDELRAAARDAVELMRLMLSLSPISPKPGIYFLLNAAGDVVYVGQSANVVMRMAGHSEKQFTDVRMLHIIPIAERNRLERMFVHHFTPPLNTALQAFNRGLALRSGARAEQLLTETRAMIVDPIQLAAFDAQRLAGVAP